MAKVAPEDASNSERAERVNVDTALQQRATATQELGMECLEKGRLLADFVMWLRTKSDGVVLEGKTWVLDSALALGPAAGGPRRALADELAPVWREYCNCPEGFGSFGDLREWQEHDLPAASAQEILSRRPDKKRVDKQHELYSFAMAAMVGIHVATVCSDIIGAGTDHKESLEQTFSPGKFEWCLQRKIRKYDIPAEGSAHSPKLATSGFQLEEFCPEYFHAVRKACGVENAELFASMCRTDFEFISFGSNSRSGETFFFSHDSNFMLKTVSLGEVEMLLTMLPEYLRRIIDCPSSLLVKYLGTYRLTLDGQTRLFLIMQNVTTHKQTITKVYDLKGSTRNRRAHPDDFIGKDLDFLDDIQKLGLPPKIAAEAVKTLEEDVELLRKYRITDYSLLVQVHDTQADAKPELVSQSSKMKLKGDADNSSMTKWCGSDNSRSAAPAALEAFQRSRGADAVDWRPSKGVWDSSGRRLYSFAVIDMLVYYGLLVKMQVCAYRMTCHGSEYSRAPPDFYCDRFIERFQNIV